MDVLFILGIVLFVAGFIFIGIEVIIPGFGAPGILGICCLVVGVFLTADSVAEALVIIAVLLVLLGIFLFILISMLTKGKLKPPIVLNEKQDKEQGYISSTDLEYLIGKKGIAVTDLRPAGRVDIEGVEFDVISDGRFINKATPVEIYRISNSSLVVKQVP